MLPIAEITADRIATWTALGLAAIAAIGTLANAALAMYAKLAAQAAQLKANGLEQRANAQHDIQQQQQAALNTVQMAMPTVPAEPVRVTPPVVKLDHAALADAIHARMTAATAKPAWPATSPTTAFPHVPPKA